MKKKDSVIIVSGGMDSITLLYDRHEYIALAVTFDYGSNHNKREIECAAYHCKVEINGGSIPQWNHALYCLRSR